MQRLATLNLAHLIDGNEVDGIVNGVLLKLSVMDGHSLKIPLVELDSVSLRTLNDLSDKAKSSSPGRL